MNAGGVEKFTMSNKAWIGVDLDGTLAEYYGWAGPDKIGKPIKLMVDRVNKWLEEGKTVKIFTARAAISEQIPPIVAWLKEHGLPQLEITNAKDLFMIELWDDRCFRVQTNTAELRSF